MHIVLLCATRRGLRFLEKLRQLCPDDDITVFSFIEDPCEPKYFDDIRQFAEGHSARFVESKNVSKHWKSICPIDLVFMVNWRYLVPIEMLQPVRLETVVLHDSLLPNYRGFSPTVWALINGEDYCGATMLCAAESVDSGDIIDQVRVKIGPEETIADVTEKVTTAYLTMLEQNLPLLKAGSATRKPQDHSLATYTCKRVPEDNLIDWREPAQSTFNLVRAVTHPYPGAYTFYRGAKLIIWSAQANPVIRRYVGVIPGRVIEIRPNEGVVVLTGEGTLFIRTVQIGDEPETCAADVIKSIATTLGSHGAIER